jgi:peptidoglycan/xylan/chitin deacetylase (PgdA/CDA1 family)
MTMLLRSLLYHRIGDPADESSPLSPDLISATPAELEAHVAHLARSYTPVTAADVVAAVTAGRSLPRKAVLVTFDDGYRDFAEIAWPILKRWRVPAVLFVPTAFPDTPGRMFWWDTLWQGVSRTDRPRVDVVGLPPLPLTTSVERRAAAVRLAECLKAVGPAEREARLAAVLAALDVRPEWTPAVSSWAELRRLAGDGVTIAGHSRTHALLDQIDDAALADEVMGCRDDLVRELGTSPPIFAYPNGNVDRRMPRVLAEGGFAVGVTTVAGLNDVGRAHRAFLRRDDGRASRFRFRLHLREPIGRLRAWRHPMPCAC